MNQQDLPKKLYAGPAELFLCGRAFNMNVVLYIPYNCEVLDLSKMYQEKEFDSHLFLINVSVREPSNFNIFPDHWLVLKPEGSESVLVKEKFTHTEVTITGLFSILLFFF